jgi:hypothetical protein
MLELVDVSQDPTEWFDRIDDNSKIQMVTTLLRDKVVLRCSARNNAELFRKIEHLETGTKKALMDFISLTPRTRTRIEVESDYKVGLDSEVGLFFDEIASEVHSKVRIRSERSMDSSNLRFWEEVLFRVAKCANKLEIYDSYGGVLLQPGKGLALKKLLELSHLEINLHADVMKANLEGMVADVNSNVLRLFDEWEEMLKSVRPTNSSNAVSRLFLYHPTRYPQHDRHLVFTFDFRKVTISFGSGLQEFDRPELGKAEVIPVSTNSDLIAEIGTCWSNIPARHKYGYKTWSGSTRT